MRLPVHTEQQDPGGFIRFSTGQNPRSGQNIGEQVSELFKQEHLWQSTTTSPPKF